MEACRASYTAEPSPYTNIRSAFVRLATGNGPWGAFILSRLTLFTPADEACNDALDD